MRTNIDIDDKLMSKAILLSSGKTKKATVEEALELLIRIKEQLKIRQFRGKLKWAGNLDEMRTDS